MNKEKISSVVFKVFTLVLCPILVITLCSVAIVITVENLVEGEKHEVTETESIITSFETQKVEATQFAVNLLSDTEKRNDAKVNFYTDLYITDITANVSEAQLGFLNYILPKSLDNVKGQYEKQGTNFGEEVQLGIVDFTNEIIEFIPELSEDETLATYTFKINPQSPFAESYQNRFNKTAQYVKSNSTKDCVIKEIVGNIAEISFMVQFNSRGEIVKTQVKQFYDVLLSVNFANSLKELSSQEINFTYEVYENADVSYVNINIKDYMVSIEEGEKYSLSLSSNIEEATPEEFELKFESSNDEIVSVNKDGKLIGLKESDEEVEIKVTLYYLGKVYTDTCHVRVGIPVKRVSTHPRKVVLTVGESTALDAVVKPKNATIKGITWFSEDESVCTVDLQGTVTALSKGETRVVVVTDDGNYTYACLVTVE